MYIILSERINELETDAKNYVSEREDIERELMSAQKELNCATENLRIDTINVSPDFCYIIFVNADTMYMNDYSRHSQIETKFSVRVKNNEISKRLKYYLLE